MMKHNLAAALVAGSSAAIAAQQTTVRQETEIRVKDGRDVRVTGCLTRSSGGRELVLTSVEGPEGRTDELARSYILVGGETDDFARHVGKLVEIEGKAADAGSDARVEVETRTEIENDEDDRERETRTEIEGDLRGVPYLGVNEVRVIRSSCS